MAEPPRRRRVPPPSRQPQSSSVLPTIALGIGVVVAGLGIGAFLSALQHRGAETTTAGALASPTPLARVTRGALAAATRTPRPTSSPVPSPTQTPTASASPLATASARTSATPRATATPAPTPTERATTAAQATETPRATPRPTAHVSARPTPRPPTPRPTPARTVTPAPTGTPRTVARASEAPVGFSGIAQSTVRRYLANLIAGNETAAFADLGKMPGDPSALTEEAFIDRGTRITAMHTTSVDPAGATVEVELRSSRGLYVATYHVVNGPSGPIIDQHDYIKI